MPVLREPRLALPSAEPAITSQLYNHWSSFYGHTGNSTCCFRGITAFGGIYLEPEHIASDGLRVLGGVSLI